MSFEIKLPLFEGPFDLLLFFIERDELDINDIPISKITNDFLDYLHNLEQLNIEVASEFILVAATLMRIKSKMLLPRPQLDEEGNEIDPREELVKHLLEYKKYKSVLEELKEMEAGQIDKEKRGNLAKELRSLSESVNVESEMQDLDLYKLLKVFQNVMERYEVEKNKPRHEVIQYPYTISGQRDFIMDNLANRNKISFGEIIEQDANKIAVIFNFLAILELLQLNMVTLIIGEGFNNFWVEKLDEVEEKA
ncbi:segregation and condensation protein A [Fulvivirga lutea]|uniref:Segregation and condensation protein A n=1 Tax=Fulvivirga lutea TaxID=2810512 RepID=A0A974WJ03_9BACT|nr:segregation/condensation protein A [Fulvivirga lutea]QSE98092.1 segregation/condensation protein A [Fulvivirga lutea]